MIVGVATPSLEIQKDAAWTRAELRRLGADFPVVIDGEGRIWKSYANEGWPALYLIDRKGRIVYDRLGEGGYADFEAEMRKALSELVDPLPPPTSPSEPRTAGCGHATRDVALGARSRAHPLTLDAETANGRRLIVESREGEVATLGKWDLEPDGLRLSRPARGDFVRVVYAGNQALAVLAPPGAKASRFFVKLDGQWLYEGAAGRDVRFDPDGRSYVNVAAARLYDLALDPKGRPHELTVAPESGGGVYGFQFADSCLQGRLP
jgi:hypothetical protein